MALVAGLLACAATAAPAQGKGTYIKPVDAVDGQLVFDVTGVETEVQAIGQGRVSYDYRQRMLRRIKQLGLPHPHHRSVSAARVKDAVATGEPVIVRKRNGIRTGTLKVTETTPTEPPTGEEPPPAEACSWGSFTGTTLPGACWRPYSDASPFNRRLPSSVSQLANSPEIGSRTANFGAGAPIFRGGVADTNGDYGHSLYLSQLTDPVYTVHCTKDWGTCPVEGAQVRIPLRAEATHGGDGHLGIIDQAANTEYGFWQVLDKPPGGGTLKISWGGKTPIGTSGATGLGSKATAAGFGLAAGVIRPDELAAGEIDHALFMGVKCTNGTSVYPAGRNTGRVCSELGLSNENAPALGSHFYLNMSRSEIDSLALPAWKKTILRAMAEYGMFVGDTGSSHNGWNLKIQSGTSYTSLGKPDPWVELGKRFNLPTWESDGRTLYSFDLRTAVNWENKLRVAAPCVAQGTC